MRRRLSGLLLVLPALLRAAWVVAGEAEAGPGPALGLTVPVTLVPVGLGSAGVAHGTLSHWLLHALHASPFARTTWTGSEFATSLHPNVSYR